MIDARRTLLPVALALVSACRCDAPQLITPEEARLTASPEALALPAMLVRQQAEGVVTVSNLGGQGVTVAVSASAPFIVSAESLTLARGESAELEVHVTPTDVGQLSGTLTVGTLEVPLSTEGLAVPECAPAATCTETHFDFSLGQCVSTSVPEGSTCATSCISAGQCTGATCVGTPKSCADSSACTVDACSEDAGCVHVPVVCPGASDACHVPACDSASGCGFREAADGTLCGPDNCRATEVNVCVGGQCVTRPRPDTGRCVNTWVPHAPWNLANVAMVYDSARAQVVLVGTQTMFETWEWDGTAWERRIPADSPPPYVASSIAYDQARQRVVLVGRTTATTASPLTWEWDGVNWTQRVSATQLPRLFDQNMIYDLARQRIVLVGLTTSTSMETWEWDGVDWLQKTSTTAPPGRNQSALGYDVARARTVLTAGRGSTTGQALSDTWEWDGTDWVNRSSMVPLNWTVATMAYDSDRGKLIALGSAIQASSLSNKVWQWTGSGWLELAVGMPPAGYEKMLVFDQARHTMVARIGNSTPELWGLTGSTWNPLLVYGSSAPEDFIYDSGRQLVVGLVAGNTANPFTLWDWNGTAWTKEPYVRGPSRRVAHSVAFDQGRNRLVVYGGLGLNDTWEFDGTHWTQVMPAHLPPARAYAAMGYSAARQRVVLFGGLDQSIPNDPAPGTRGDTWEWDGTDWTQHVVSPAPPARELGLMAWDSAHNTLQLVGGYPQQQITNPHQDTWEWTGTWHLTPATTTGRGVFGLAYDSVRQRTLMLEAGATVIGHWEFDGTRWTQERPTIFPPYGMRMVYDAARQQTLAFYGFQVWRYLP